MFDLRYLVLAVMAAAMLTCGSGMSYIDVSSIINKTVCAIAVHHDYDRHRIPATIKMIRCADSPDRGCSENSDHRYCCEQKGRKCVEVLDKATVFSKQLNKSKEIEVSVGCACMISDGQVARTIDDQHRR